MGVVFTFKAALKKKSNSNLNKQNSSTAHSEEEQILIKGCVSVFPTSFVNTNSALDFKGIRTLHYWKTGLLSSFLGWENYVHFINQKNVFVLFTM